MKICAKPNPDIRSKIKELHNNDDYYIGPHEVNVKLYITHASISIKQGSLVSLDNDIKVKRHPFTFFGLKTIKPFKERVQCAVDVMQHICDDLDALEIENIEIEIDRCNE